MLTFLQNSSNQRKIALAIAAFLALFSQKVPFLADVNPDNIQFLIVAIVGWIAQSGIKAAAQANADGAKHAAMIANANDAVAVFNQLAGQKVVDPAPPQVNQGAVPVKAS